MLPIVVTIAGTDPSGGAGIQADIKAISATGCYAASIITALVAQNTQGVQTIQEIPPAFLEQQFISVFSDLTIDAVKIGMLHNTHIIKVVAAKLEEYRPQYVVFDPVMVAKNGSPLMESDVVDTLKASIFPHCYIITPNLPEAETLLGRTISSHLAMEEASKELGQQFKFNVLLKGGHFVGEQASDVLYLYETGHHTWFHAPHISTRNTHGTGCSLSSALASFLAQSYTLVDAVDAAKCYLTHAIRSGSRLTIGHGHGPVDHFYFLRKQ